jgi:hypothetical protein
MESAAESSHRGLSNKLLLGEERPLSRNSSSASVPTVSNAWGKDEHKLALERLARFE